MKYNDYYDVIFKRKSIRKYTKEPINEKTLEDISTYMHSVGPLYKNIQVEMKIVTQEEVKSLLPIKAPYYILVSSENKEGYLTNVGFLIQQVDLYLSNNGIGSCWVGMAQPKKEIVKKSELEFVIALSFGYPEQILHRENISEFKRKNIEEIRDVKERDRLIEAARLAPSATNSQPWYFKIENNKIHSYCIKPNFLKAILYKKMNQVDMGIAINHLWIAAKHYGNDVQYIVDEEVEENAPSGYYYIGTLVINE